MPAPDDIYRKEIDFTSLSLQYPKFAKRLKQNGQLDFSNPESVRQLTKSLLHRDFALDIDLPEDRLCPPVPNRFNYILFIQRLIDSTSPDFHEGYDPERRVVGIDIGTGSSCIYPLLGCRQRDNWFFLATEIDEKNQTYAAKNIATNGLESRIKLINTDPQAEALIPVAAVERVESIDFLMTNPPFYASAASMAESAKQKSRPPNSSCTGAAVEMITAGGEVAFVARLIAESRDRAVGSRIQWFSSMLGKLASVGGVVEALREHGCANHTVAEFVQGQKTRRWCVAWSWRGYRPALAVARPGGASGGGVERRLLPVATEVEFVVGGGADEVAESVGQEVGLLDVKYKFHQARRVGMLLSVAGDVWSRKARRKMGKKREDDEEMKDQDDDEDDDDEDSENEKEPGLVAKLSFIPGSARGPVATTVRVRWLQGQEAVVFESFCGWLKRKLEARD